MTRPASPAPNPAKHRPALLWLVLIVIGIGWGITGPFSKLAVSTGNHPIGVTFWNTVIGAVVLTAVLLLSGRRLPLDRRHLVFFLICGLLGTALPNSLSYTAYQHLPIGVMSIIIALVPMATLAFNYRHTSIQSLGRFRRFADIAAKVGQVPIADLGTASKYAKQRH